MEESEASEITGEETLDYVTPYALNLNPKLMGLPLAGPAKRLIAIAIDGLAIALISKVSFFLAIAIFALAFFKRHRPKSTGSHFIPDDIRARVIKVLKALTKLFVVLIFILAVIGLASYIYVEYDETGLKNWNQSTTINSIEIKKEDIKRNAWAFRAAIHALDEKINNQDCEDLQCWQQSLAELAQMLPEFLEEEKSKEVTNSYVQESGLNDDEKIVLRDFLYSHYDKTDRPTRQIIAEPQVDLNNKSDAPSITPSIITWARGMLTDLGLGFGWAAVYFTVLTSGFSGRTLGKYLMHIQVRKLDNSKITFWDSFGRYGGYGAGLSTGLLGFMQIYWDPNRQAIQDKIAGTIVVDLAKPGWQEKRESA